MRGVAPAEADHTHGIIESVGDIQRLPGRVGDQRVRTAAVIGDIACEQAYGNRIGHHSAAHVDYTDIVAVAVADIEEKTVGAAGNGVGMQPERQLSAGICRSARR